VTVGVRLDPRDPTPQYEQVRRQVATAIASGALASGARLPTVRRLAADLGVAPGTVMRAYRGLEASGLATSRRGAGTTGAARAAPASRLSDGERRRALDDLATAYVTQGRLLGRGTPPCKTPSGARCPPERGPGPGPGVRLGAPGPGLGPCDRSGRRVGCSIPRAACAMCLTAWCGGRGRGW